MKRKEQFLLFDLLGDMHVSEEFTFLCEISFVAAVCMRSSGLSGSLC
jgi:hypothetical protein